MKNSDNSTTLGPGARLRAERVAAKIERADLAVSLGITVSRLGDIEADRKPVTLETIDRVAAAIGCDPYKIDQRLSPFRLRKS